MKESMGEDIDSRKVVDLVRWLDRQTQIRGMIQSAPPQYHGLINPPWKK